MNSEHISATVDPARFRTTRRRAIDVTPANRMRGDRAATAELCQLHHGGQEISTLHEALIAAKGQL